MQIHNNNKETSHYVNDELIEFLSSFLYDSYTKANLFIVTRVDPTYVYICILLRV